MEMHEYMEILTNQMRSEKARKMVADEIQGHIEDQKRCFVEAGMSEEKAEIEAIRQMGDPVEVGVSMDWIHRPRMDWKAIIIVAIFSITGMILQYHSFMFSGWMQQEVVKHIVLNMGVFALIGFLCMIGICFLDYTIFYRHGLLAFVLVFIFIWIGSIGLFEEINNLGNGDSYQGQYVYLFLPLYGGLLYKMRGHGYPAVLGCIGFGLLVVICARPVFSVNYAFRLGVAVIMMTSFAIYKGWFQGSRLILLLDFWMSLIGVIIAGIGSMVLRGGYPLARLKMIFNWQIEDWYYGNVFQTLRDASQKIEWFGAPNAVEVWQNVVKAGGAENRNILYLFLSRGCLPGILMLAIYLFFWGYLLRFCLRQKNELGKIIGFGCTLLLGMEALDYVLANFAIICPGNNNMPFLQPGGVGSVVYYILIGILLSIYRYQDVLPANVEESGIKTRFRIIFRIEKA